jgi:hypothetical protein
MNLFCQLGRTISLLLFTVTKLWGLNIYIYIHITVKSSNPVHPWTDVFCMSWPAAYYTNIIKFSSLTILSSFPLFSHFLEHRLLNSTSREKENDFFLT